MNNRVLGIDFEIHSNGSGSSVSYICSRCLTTIVKENEDGHIISVYHSKEECDLFLDLSIVKYIMGS